MRTGRTIARFFSILVFLDAVTAHAQSIHVTPYATATNPQVPSFDGSGNLFLGSEYHNCWMGGSQNPVTISRVGAGSGAGVSFGPAIDDPDVVLVDRDGVFSAAGSVLVAGALMSPPSFQITGIDTTQSATVLYTHTDPSGNWLNPTAMAIDGGRLIIACGSFNGGPNEILAWDGTSPATALVTLAPADVPLSIAIDNLGDIYVSFPTRISIYANGGSAKNSFAQTNGNGFLAFGPGGCWGMDLYFLNFDTGILYRFDSLGAAVALAQFPGNQAIEGMVFGADGALYLSDWCAGKVLRAECRPCTPPPQGMVSWWPGDKNPQDIADSNTGTLKYGASFGLGKVQQSFDLTSTASSPSFPHVEVSDNASLWLPQLTIDAWVKWADPNSPPGGNPPGSTITPAMIVSRIRPEGYGYELHISWAEPIAQFDLYQSADHQNGTFATLYGSRTITDGGWHHIAGTYDGTWMNLYVDGVLDNALHSVHVGTSSTTGPGPAFFPEGPLYLPGDPLFIGERSHQAREQFKGWIDEVEIFDRALTPSEIQEIYFAGSAGKCKCRPLADGSGCTKGGCGCFGECIDGGYCDNPDCCLVADDCLCYAPNSQESIKLCGDCFGQCNDGSYCDDPHAPSSCWTGQGGPVCWEPWYHYSVYLCGDCFGQCYDGSYCDNPNNPNCCIAGPGNCACYSPTHPISVKMCGAQIDSCHPSCVNYNPATQTTRVIDCDCGGVNQCHATVPASGSGPPTCIDGCRSGEACEKTETVNADGSIDICCTCSALCEPLPDGSACRPAACSDPSYSCKPTEIIHDSNTGQITVSACDCVKSDECYFPPESIFCDGTVCPRGAPGCEEAKFLNCDGTETIFCCTSSGFPECCEPLPDGSGCTQTCDNPGLSCEPVEVTCTPGTYCIVTKCDCIARDSCHVGLSEQDPPGPICDGGCPGQSGPCHLEPSGNDSEKCACPFACFKPSDCDDGDICTLDGCVDEACFHAVIDPCCPPSGPCPCLTDADCGFGFCCDLATGVCQAPPCGDIPAVSEWGLIVMTLLLLIGAKIYFSGREATPV